MFTEVLNTYQRCVHRSVEHLSEMCSQKSWGLTRDVFTEVLNTYQRCVHRSVEHLPEMCSQKCWTLTRDVFTKVLNTYQRCVHRSVEHLPEMCSQKCWTLTRDVFTEVLRTYQRCVHSFATNPLCALLWKTDKKTMIFKTHSIGHRHRTICKWLFDTSYELFEIVYTIKNKWDAFPNN